MSTALTAPYSAVPILQFLQRRSKLCILFEAWVKVICIYCEAQGKGSAKGRPRKVTQMSFIDGGWWMVDIDSLMLYIKFG